MRWPKPRLRVRSLLMLMAIAALAMGLERRRADCLARAAGHRRLFWRWNGNHLSMPIYARNGASAPSPRPKEDEEDRIAECDRHYAWDLRLARRFERAADRPWVPVPSDPPEPEALLGE